MYQTYGQEITENGFKIVFQYKDMLYKSDSEEGDLKIEIEILDKLKSVLPDEEQAKQFLECCNAWFIIEVG